MDSYKLFGIMFVILFFLYMIFTYLSFLGVDINYMGMYIYWAILLLILFLLFSS